MRITFLGHAGLFIEAAGVTVLCDPWFNPAFFDAWYPFPRNDQLCQDSFAAPDFVYISHSHRDHFDVTFLQRISKEATVLLPDFPLRDHETELRSVGFKNFLKVSSGRPEVFGDLRVAIEAQTDEATGDSALMIDDGETRVLNQNDARPLSLETISAFGPYHAHFVQFSGAMWYPAVYRWSAALKATLIAETRDAQAKRALAYIRDVDAAHVFPSAGPACFLDDELFGLNDIPGKTATIFPDQTVFLERMHREGVLNGHLVVPGTVIELRGSSCCVEHPVLESVIRSDVFGDKERYLRNYAEDVSRAAAVISARPKSGGLDLVAELREWLIPVMNAAPTTCAGIGGAVLLDWGDAGVRIDFVGRTVEPYDGVSECPYRYFMRRDLLERLILRREVDWVNSLFLSCRFEAERDGGYNEWLYTFFKGMSVPRARHLELAYSAPPPADEPDFLIAGYLVQRRCPHFKADLMRFGHVENGVLTCAMHGWRFDLASGRCLTAEGRAVRAKPVTDGPTVNVAVPPEASREGDAS